MVFAILAAAQFSIAIGPATAADISEAIALVVRRPEAVSMIRQYRGGVDFSTNPDIVYRREGNDTVYCPHQVLVFMNAYGPDILENSPVYELRWVVNTVSKRVTAPVQILPMRTNIDTTLGAKFDARCIDGSRPVRLPE